MKKYLGLLIIVFLILSGCSSKSEAGSRKISSNSIKEIYIATEGENIVVKESDGSDIKVTFNKNDRLQVKQDGSQLNIHVKESSSFINFKSETLTISLPKSCKAALHIKTVAGKVLGENIANEKLFVTSESGDIELKNVKGEFVNDSKISSVASNIDVQLNSDKRGYFLDLSTKTGKIKSDLNLTHIDEEKSNRTLKGYTGEKNIEKSNIVIESDTGTISVQ